MRVRAYTVNQLATYAGCPLRYLYAYRYQDPERQHNPRLVQHELTRAALLDALGRDADLKTALEVFEGRFLLWAREHGRALSDLTPRLAAGRIALRALYERERSHVILGVQVPLRHTLFLPRSQGKHGRIRIDGEADLVRQVPHGKSRQRIEVVRYYAGTRELSRFEACRDIYGTLIRWLFRQSYKDKLNDRKKSGKLWSIHPRLIHTHLGTQHELVTPIDKGTWQARQSWIGALVQAIDRELYYPSVSRACLRCPFQPTCDPRDARWTRRKQQESRSQE